MRSSHRRWSARSNSDPPFPAAWALDQAQSPPVADETDAADMARSPEGNATSPRGRVRGATIASPTAQYGYTYGAMGVEAGLDAMANPKVQAPHPHPIIAPSTPKNEAPGNLHLGPLSGGQTPQQTFWIPFTLTPGGVGGAGRLTPINRRVPAHLRAAASALNIKMTYTRNAAGDYVFTHTPGGGATPAIPRTPFNERDKSYRPSVARPNEGEHVRDDDAGQGSGTVASGPTSSFSGASAAPSMVPDAAHDKETADHNPDVSCREPPRGPSNAESRPVKATANVVILDASVDIESIPAMGTESVAPASTGAPTSSLPDSTQGPPTNPFDESFKREVQAGPEDEETEHSPEAPAARVDPVESPEETTMSSEMSTSSSGDEQPVHDSSEAVVDPDPAIELPPITPPSHSDSSSPAEEDPHDISESPEVNDQPAVMEDPSTIDDEPSSDTSEEPAADRDIPAEGPDASSETQAPPPVPPLPEPASEPALSEKPSDDGSDTTEQPDVDATITTQPPEAIKEDTETKTSPSKPKRRRSKRDSLGPTEHIITAHVEKPAGLPPAHPLAVVGAPRARSNTTVEAPLLSKPERPSSRPAAMRATASRVQAQLNAATNAGTGATSRREEPDAGDDTDGEPSWAWNELMKQLDEEDERKKRAHANQRHHANASDVWFTTFQRAWDANMLKARGVRTWWDLEKYWRPSDVFGTSDHNAAASGRPHYSRRSSTAVPPPAPHIVPEPKVDEPVEHAVEVENTDNAPAAEPTTVPAGKAQEAKTADAPPAAGGEETLVSSPEGASPHRSDSRNSLKTLGGPSTDQSKRSSMSKPPQPQAASSQSHPVSDHITEDATASSSSSSASSSTSESGASTPRSDKEDGNSAGNSGAREPPSDTKEREPIFQSSDIRTMWEEVERQSAEEEESNTKAAEEKPAETQSTEVPDTLPRNPRRHTTANDRERARDRFRESRAPPRVQTRDGPSGADADRGRPPMFQRESYVAGGHHQQQRAEEQANVYSQFAQDPTFEQPSISARRQSEPHLQPMDLGDDSAENLRRGRDARPKLRVNTDFTDYTQSAHRAPPRNAQPQRSQSQPRAMPAPHARPVHPSNLNPNPGPNPQVHSKARPHFQQSHSYAHSQARPHSQSQSQSQSQPPKAKTQAKPPPEPRTQSRPASQSQSHAQAPFVLRPVDRSNSKVALAWKAYEARWTTLLAPQNRERITFATIPWPVLHPPTNYADGAGLNALTTLAIAQFLLSADHSPGITARDRLRGAIRRWHSDKFGRFASRMGGGDGEDPEEEKRKIMEGVGVVARSLTQLLELERGDS